MSMHSYLTTTEPEAEARAFFVLRKPDGELAFTQATEIFAGTLQDALNYVWHFPQETRRHAYIESDGTAMEPDEIEAIRP